MRASGWRRDGCRPQRFSEAETGSAGAQLGTVFKLSDDVDDHEVAMEELAKRAEFELSLWVGGSAHSGAALVT